MQTRGMTMQNWFGFRPLTEDNFTISHIDSKEKNHTPEKRGWSRNDKP